VVRYVLSGSSKAVESTVYNVPHRISAAQYNLDAIEAAICRPNEDTFERKLTLYSAGRVMQELTLQSWMAEYKPSYVANIVVPDGNFGRVLDANNIASTPAQLKSALTGEWEKVPLPLGNASWLQMVRYHADHLQHTS
jgi:hypothetical protein